MVRNVKSERGLSLIEATIILMVLSILTATLAPTLGDYVNDARQTKAKEDVEALGASVLRLLRDTGLPFPVRAAGASPSKASTNRVDLLVTEGATPTKSTNTGTGLLSGAGNYLVEAAVEWDDSVADAEVDLATDHLVTNGLATPYTTVAFPASGGPRPGLGWRGGYLSTATGPDPWGVRYGCTTVWLNPGSDTSGAGKGTNNDAFCLTAGADGNVDTDMDGNGNGGVTVGGDDLIFVMQGNTR